MLQPILLFRKRIENPYKILQRSGNINSYVDLRNRKTTLDEDIYVHAAVLARGLVDVGNDVKIFILFSTPVNIMTDIAQKLSRGSIELKSTWFFFFVLQVWENVVYQLSRFLISQTSIGIIIFGQTYTH